MNTPVKAVVFDLDGTLVDSMPMVLRAYAHALEPFVPPMSPHDLFLRLGAPPERTFAEMLAGPTEVAVAMQRLVEYSSSHWHHIQAFQGMHDVLRDLRAAARRTGIWTGRDRRSTEAIMREHRLEAWVEELVCGDDLPSHKPDPAGLSAVLDRLGARPHEVFFAGDADVDVLAGHAIGVRTVLIRHGRPVADDVLRRAWRVVETPADAYALLRRAAGSLV
jgi:pyrophosphatase PpaX